MARIHITSDGTPWGTRVTADGKELPNVRSVTWTVSVDEIATATFIVDDVEIDAAGFGRPENANQHGWIARRLMRDFNYRPRR